MRDAFGNPQHVAIVGGASDIGLAVFDALDAEHLHLLGRDPDGMRAARPDARPIRWDARDGETHATATQQLFDGPDIDVVIIAAGVLHPDPSPGQIGEMVEVNATGPVAIMAHIAERLRQQGHGTLVVLSSIAAVRPRPSNLWYGAGKAALDFAARGLMSALEGTGVDVIVVRPGFVRSTMTEGLPDAPFSVDPDDVGAAVAEAVKDRLSGVLWIPGILRLVAAMLAMLPSSIVKRLDQAQR